VPNLSLIVCGAPLASRAHDVAAALELNDWSVTPVVTSAAGAWLDSIWPLASFRDPNEAKAPRPDAVAVCPMTFNTANKLVHGLADSPR
jgi:hypothetical protein